MILYGGKLNYFEVLLTGTPFTVYGAVKKRLRPAVDQPVTFPIYGATLKTLIAPIHHKIYGATLCYKLPPTRFTIYGAKNNTISQGANLLGLSISNLAQVLNFNTPAYTYNIAPYYSSDVATILGTTNSYTVVGSDVVFTTLPTGPIKVILFDRLKIYANEIKELEVTNTIPQRAIFSDIKVSSDTFTFSLDKLTWHSQLTVSDIFYIKAPDMLTDGQDFSQEILVTATVLPRG